MKKVQVITEGQDPCGYLRLVLRHSAECVDDPAVLRAAVAVLFEALGK